MLPPIDVVLLQVCQALLGIFLGALQQVATRVRPIEKCECARSVLVLTTRQTHLQRCLQL